MAFGIVACSSDDSDGENNITNNFDRNKMLTNWADNLIIPSYQNFASKTNSLQTANTTFVNETNLENLTNLRAAWQDAYIAWQKVEMYDIGPARDVVLRSFVNTYPTNAENVNLLIESQNYNLADPNLNDEQGFPALDYLLFGIAESDTELVELYDNDANGDKYRQYLTDVVTRINSLGAQVLDDWQNAYRDVFVQNSGSSANSSTNRMANVFMEYYEVRFRNGKIGFPAGVYSGGDPQPNRVEAFYNKELSKSLALEALEAHKNFFNGNEFNENTSAESFANYLDFLDVIKNGDSLSSLINNQYEESITSINALDNSFYNQINTNNNGMLEVFESLQDNVVFLKSDMFSALSIALEFDSGDGD
ncbi:iron-regulated protein A precursor [Psychroflexus salis]|uniref:Iron-regulated protein A n=2 Tax=Psychroflexus salis TaxID=1526574 RepID=A0A916ZVH8_9FLAO|nr:iron-regulated protein A precursor [Psychroflexus salis]